MTVKYYKHPKFGHVYGDTLPTPIGRACWVSLVTAKDPPPPAEGQAPGQPRFEMTLLLQKGDKEVDKFLARVKEMTDEMLVQYNEKKSAKIGEVSLVMDGDAFDMDKYPYYKNCWALVARNTQKPQVVDFAKDRKPIVVENSSIIGGMKARMVVTPLITAHGVSYKLSVAQLVEDDGVRFGGGNRDMVSFLDAITEEEPTMAEVAAEALGNPAETVGDAPKAPVEIVAATQAEVTASKRGKKAALDML